MSGAELVGVVFGTVLCSTGDAFADNAGVESAIRLAPNRIARMVSPPVRERLPCGAGLSSRSALIAGLVLEEIGAAPHRTRADAGFDQKISESDAIRDHAGDEQKSDRRPDVLAGEARSKQQ